MLAAVLLVKCDEHASLVRAASERRRRRATERQQLFHWGPRLERLSGTREEMSQWKMWRGRRHRRLHKHHGQKARSGSSCHTHTHTHCDAQHVDDEATGRCPIITCEMELSQSRPRSSSDAARTAQYDDERPHPTSHGYEREKGRSGIFTASSWNYKPHTKFFV